MRDGPALTGNLPRVGNHEVVVLSTMTGEGEEG